MVEPDCYVSGPSAHELGGTLNGVRGSWATATIEQRRSVCVQQHVVDESRGHRMDAYGKATVTDTRDCELHGAGGLSGSQHASLEAQGAPGAGRGMDMPLASEGVALSPMLPVQRGEAGGGSCGVVGTVHGGASTDLGLEGGQWSPWPIEWSYPTMVWDITVESSHLGQGSAAMPWSPLTPVATDRARVQAPSTLRADWMWHLLRGHPVREEAASCPRGQWRWMWLSIK